MKSVSCSRETVALVLWLLKSGNYKLNAAGEIIGKVGVLRHGKTKGYPKMEVVDGNGVVRHLFKHTFIAIALWGPIPDGHTVNHKDGVRWNCSPENLEVIPHKDNIKHSIETGLQPPVPRGQKNWNARLTDAQVVDIKVRRANGESGYSIAADLGVSHSLVYHIARNERRKYG